MKNMKEFLNKFKKAKEYDPDQEQESWYDASKDEKKTVVKKKIAGIGKVTWKTGLIAGAVILALFLLNLGASNVILNKKVADMQKKVQDQVKSDVINSLTSYVDRTYTQSGNSAGTDTDDFITSVANAVTPLVTDKLLEELANSSSTINKQIMSSLEQQIKSEVNTAIQQYFEDNKTVNNMSEADLTKLEQDIISQVTTQLTQTIENDLANYVTVAQYEADQNTINQQIIDVTNNNTTLVADNKDLKAQIDDLTARIKELESKSSGGSGSDDSSKIEDLQKQIDALNDIIKELKSNGSTDTETITNLIKQLQDADKALQAAIDANSVSSNEQMAQLKAEQKQIKDAQDLINNSVNNSLTEIIKEIGGLKLISVSGNGASESDFSTIDAELDEINSLITKLENGESVDLNDLSDKITKLLKDINSAITSETTAKENATSTTEKNTHSNNITSLKALQTQVNSISAVVNNFIKSNSVSSNTVNITKEEYEKLLSIVKNSSLTTNMQDILNNLIKNYYNNSSDANKQALIDKINELLDSYNSIQKLLDNLKQAKSDYDKATESMNDAKDALDSAKTAAGVDSKQSALDSAKDELSKAKDAQSSLSDNATQDDKDAAQKAVDDAQSKVDSAQSDLDSAKSQVADAQKAYDDAESAYEQAKSALEKLIGDINDKFGTTYTINDYDTIINELNNNSDDIIKSLKELYNLVKNMTSTTTTVDYSKLYELIEEVLKAKGLNLTLSGNSADLNSEDVDIINNANADMTKFKNKELSVTDYIANLKSYESQLQSHLNNYKANSAGRSILNTDIATIDNIISTVNSYVNNNMADIIKQLQEVTNNANTYTSTEINNLINTEIGSKTVWTGLSSTLWSASEENRQAILTESQNRIDADTTLTNALNKEIQDRTDAINTESANRIAADNKLTKDLNTESENRIKDMDNKKIKVISQTDYNNLGSNVDSSTIYFITN